MDILNKYANQIPYNLKRTVVGLELIEEEIRREQETPSEMGLSKEL